MQTPKAETGHLPKAETGPETGERLSFPDWAAAMAAAGWPPDSLRRRQLAVMRLLKYAKTARTAVSVPLIKEFIARAESDGTL